MEVCAFTDRNLQRHDGFAEKLTHTFERAKEVGIFHIHLVDIDEAWQVQLFAVLPCTNGVNLDAGFCRDNEHETIGCAQRFADFAAEFRIPWGVDEVQLVAVPFAWRHAKLDRYVAGDFFRFKVEDVFVILAAAYSVNALAHQEHRLYERRFAGAIVGQHRDITDDIAVIIFHKSSSLLPRWLAIYIYKY